MIPTSSLQKKAPTPPSILLFGQDLRLVETRRWVLEKAGFRLFTALRLADLDHIATGETINLFMLCDSLSPDTRKAALHLIHARWPDAKLLVLTPAGNPTEIDPAVAVFPAMEGPGKLLITIHQIMTSDNMTSDKEYML